MQFLDDKCFFKILLHIKRIIARQLMARNKKKKLVLVVRFKDKNYISIPVIEEILEEGLDYMEPTSETALINPNLLKLKHSYIQHDSYRKKDVLGIDFINAFFRSPLISIIFCR